MTFIQSIILGIIQGITEFLPISSSAHLVLVPYLLNWNLSEELIFPFDVLVQSGTLLAILYYYREDLMVILRAMLKGIAARKPLADIESRTGWLTLLATVPAGLIGYLIKPLVKSTFSNPAVTSVFLFVTAALLVASEVLGKKNREIGDLTWKDALWIGAFQILAVFPGISRSGATITGGMTRNLKRKTAGQFTFLMAIPILLAAGIMEVVHLSQIPDVNSFLPLVVTGFIVSTIVGYFAISWLIDYMSNHSLLPFAAYCILLGAGSLALILFNPEPTIGSTTSSSEASSKNNTYTIGIDPNLEWMIPKMNNCQRDMPEIEIVYQQYADTADALDLFDAYFTYNDPQASAAYTYQLGEERLAIVVNPSGSVQALNTSAVNGIFSGRLTTWQAFYDSCNECFSSTEVISSESINVWALPEDSIFWDEFNAAYLGNPLSSFAHIAPDSKSVRQMVSSDQNSIGILSSGWLDESIKAIDVVDEPESIESAAITVSTMSEPDENLSLWLNCLQTEINP